MKTKLTKRFWTALTVLSLVGQVAWVVENMYLNVFLYKMFHASADEISTMVSASATAAAVTTVLMGALTDKVGKRKIFVCGGYLLWGISILSFCLIRLDILRGAVPAAVNASALAIQLVIAVDCLMTFFGSTANDAAFNAWLTDSTDHTNRGAVEGINSMMPLVAILVVFGGFLAFDLNQPESWTWIFAIIGGVVFCVGIAAFFLMEEEPQVPSDTGYWENVLYSFRPSSLQRHPRLYAVLGVFSVFNVAIQVFMPYLILYYEVSLGMANYVLIMAPAIILASIVTAFWGKVYDRRGFRFSGLLAVGSLALGCGILYIARNTIPVFIGSLFLMIGYLAGGAVFGADIRSVTPEGRSGQLQGLRITTQVLLPGILGPKLGAWLLRNAELITNSDGTTSFVPNADIFLASMILALAVEGLTLVLSNWKKR